MTALSRLRGPVVALSLMLATVVPVPVAAQNIGYGNPDDGGDAPQGKSGESGRRGSQAKGRHGLSISPYIEAQQVVTKELSPGDDVLTWSRLAVGVDGSVEGRHSAAAVSLRYERSFGWGKATDYDALSGIARGYTAIAPGLQIEAGAMASRMKVENDANVSRILTGRDDHVTQVYSAYAGPTYAGRVDDVQVNAGYQFGYTEVGQPKGYVPAPGATAVDVFDHSTAHLANLRAGVRPGDVLPVGIGAGASYYREDISNLDQRIEDFAGRLDFTLPVTHEIALVAGVGYEDVEFSNRDAVRDASGNPVVGSDGRLVTDKSAPRLIGYDTSGFIWDAGVMWRPNHRTAFEAHVGRRYGSTSVYGSGAWQIDGRSSLNVAAYDNVAGFGGQAMRGLIGMPSNFEAQRDPLTGDIGTCVTSVEKGNGCIGGSLTSLRSAAFRSRGFMASYNLRMGHKSLGFGAGYDRRRFIGARGTVLAPLDGKVDENWWLNAWLAGELDPRSGYSVGVMANWFQSGLGSGGDEMMIGANSTYYRRLTERLTATAALGIYGTSREDPFDDAWYASALLGVRYSF